MGNRRAKLRGCHQCLRAACRSACAVAVCNAMLNSAGVKLGSVLATAAISAGAGVPTAIGRVMHEAMLEVSAMVRSPQIAALPGAAPTLKRLPDNAQNKTLGGLVHNSVRHRLFIGLSFRDRVPLHPTLQPDQRQGSARWRRLAA